MALASGAVLTGCGAVDTVTDTVWDVADGVADVAGDAVDVVWDVAEWAADLAGDAADAVVDAGEAVVDGAKEMVDGDDMDGDMDDDADAQEGDVEVGMYDTYSPATLASAVEDGKKVAVFFHGATCGSCATLDADIKDNIANIPGDVVVLNADWDDNQELAEEYGVAKYHTVTMVTNDKKNVGNLFTLDDLVAEL